ncbi:RHS repeat domain-containing protein, partial [Serratia marcescens]
DSRSADIYWYHTDLNSAPLEVTDAAGNLCWSGQYDTFGKLQGQTVAGAAKRQGAQYQQPLRYAGQYQDDESGLHYNLFRYYEPEVGRFTTQDPIGLRGGLNLYQYAPNPLNWIDPLGLSKCEPEKWDVNSHQGNKNAVKGKNLGLDSHHVGQKNIMKDLVEGYDPATAPAMLVPRVGHTVSKEGVGIVSRSKINPSTGLPFTNARDVVARDIRELRRVYPEIPNGKLRELIDLNKKMYPELRARGIYE